MVNVILIFSPCVWLEGPNAATGIYSACVANCAPAAIHIGREEV
jgi:hypothetical protein